MREPVRPTKSGGLSEVGTVVLSTREGIVLSIAMTRRVLSPRVSSVSPVNVLADAAVQLPLVTAQLVDDSDILSAHTKTPAALLSSTAGV